MGEESQYTPCEGQQLFLVPGSSNKGWSCVDNSGGPGTLQPFHPQLRDLSREDLNVKAEAQELLGGGEDPFLLRSFPAPKYSQASLKICQYPNPNAAQLTNHGSSEGKSQG